VEFATGEPENPVARPALLEKFVGLANGLVTNPNDLAARILSIESETDVRALAASLRG
jgi:hypothetical protein